MSLFCININSLEYQTLKKLSGLQEFKLKAYCNHYLSEFGRFPYLDELPNIDSSNIFKDDIKLNKYNSTKINNILDLTQTSSIEEANIKLNDTYRDLEITLTPLNKEVYVEINKRPKLGLEIQNIISQDSTVSSRNILVESLHKLEKLYGILTIPITILELQEGDLKEIAPYAQATKAFFYNGNIYVNTNLATVDSLIHELLHVFIGAIRFSNPEIYQSLISFMEPTANFELLKHQFPYRTQNDLLEEYLVLELSKYLTNQLSDINYLPKPILHEILYNTQRTLDSILMGETSVKSLQGINLYKRSLQDISSGVQSSLFHNNFQGSLSDMLLHRIAMNTKLELKRKGQLIEECN